MSAAGLEENHTIKKTLHVCAHARTHAHIRMQLQHGASCIVFFFVICFGLFFSLCVMQPTLLFFYFSHLSQNNTSPIILKYTHCCFQICWLPPVKRLVSGRGEKKIKAPQKQNMNEYIDNHKSEVLFKETRMRHSFDFVL